VRRAAGGGVRYAGSFTDGAGTPPTPSVTLLDAMLAWDSTRWRLAFNVSNLADKQYFSNCWSWGECSYGAARDTTPSATYRF
jgi:iron complex outermembrane receptor protein